VNKMILDVGCGSSPKGHVNIDLFVEETPHRKKGIINSKLIPNFIKAHAQYLPIRDKSFDTVYSHHLIEHLYNPTKAILEMLRVTKNEVIIIIPHRYSRERGFKYKQCNMHKNFFSAVTTRKWLKSLNLIFEIEIIYNYIPHKFIPIIKIPNEIKIRICK